MTTHRVVTRKEWIRERMEHLAREKEFTRLRDRLSAERRALPWAKVDEPYAFDTPGTPTARSMTRIPATPEGSTC
jgi:predicted dithiol-disulfide oxidoreductase (DUF899 family)